MSGRRNDRMIRKRFLLYPCIEIANFKEEDRDNSNAHSSYICVGTAHVVSVVYYTSVRILFLLFILPRRLAMPDTNE